MINDMKIKFLEANCGDSIIISFVAAQGHLRPLLLDGGTGETYSSKRRKGELYYVIEDICNKGQAIDLLILTHIDNDHIGGILKWFEEDKRFSSIVKNVWFNSGKLIAEYFKQPENPDLNVGLNIFRNAYTGVSEAEGLEEILLKYGMWDRKIILRGQNVNQYGVAIQVLAPNESQLRELLEEYRKVNNDPAYTAAKKSDWGIDLKTFIEEEKNGFNFKEQKEPKNGSSIAIILTIEGKKLLLLGDAPPGNVISALNSLGYIEDNPLEVDLFKISHHGSQYSTSKDLLKLVRTDKYIICTDGSGNSKHPDKRTIARIIDVNPKANIYFNYEHIGQKLFSDSDCEDFKEFRIGTIMELENGEG